MWPHFLLFFQSSSLRSQEGLCHVATNNLFLHSSKEMRVLCLFWVCVRACVYVRMCFCMCGCIPSFAGLERDKFDNKTVTFEEHIKVEHNMWHYLFFIVLVKVKDSTEYTGPESYVAEMIRVRTLSCICTAGPIVGKLSRVVFGINKICLVWTNPQFFKLSSHQSAALLHLVCCST